jgi:uncharacterized protein (DUF1015 family)
MAIIKAFKGIRPVESKAKDIASLPYDVINRQEARQLASNNPFSFLHIVKPEIDFEDNVDEHAIEIYKHGKNYIDKLLKEGVLVEDNAEYLYVYAQTMHGRTQYGLVACAHIDDYQNNVILKHELTRPDKEEDRKNHIRYSLMNYEPVFFAYPALKEIDVIIADVIKAKPVYDFLADDGIAHQLWVIKEEATNNKLVELFKSVPHTYVADGHHRTAAAAGVGAELRAKNKNHSGLEEYNYFLAVHFPDNQLKIMDYNRVVKDLNGLSPEQFLNKIEQSFEIEKKGTTPYQPDALHVFSLYLEGQWYALKAKSGTYNDNDPIGCLDVTILSDSILAPILNITDLRNSKRIDFVGGIRGIGELKRRVDNGEMAAAFALYPVSMKQLFDIANTGNIMPPKTTWFEPKLRSGLIIHNLE